MSLRLRLGSVFGATALVVCGARGTAQADNSVAAQTLFDEGKKAMAAHDYASACPKLDASLKLEFALGTLLNLADCNEKAGKVATAWAQFLELAGKASAAGQTERYRLGKDRAGGLAGRLPKLVIRVNGAVSGEEVKRDGTVIAETEIGLAIPVDPGSHTIEAAAPGKRPWSTSVTIGDGATASTVIVPPLEALPESRAVAADTSAPPSSSVSPALPPLVPDSRASAGLGTNKILAIVGLGGAVAAAGVGSYFGLQSLSDHNQANSLCPTPTCPPGAPGDRGASLWQSARTQGDRATISFAIAGGLLGAAVVLWVTAPSASASATRVGLGLDGVRIQGTW